MFGYVTVDVDNLKVKDYRRYEAFYCGVCQDLKKSYGARAQMTLTYDMTFLGILLTGLYETPAVTEKHFCIAHPGRKKVCLRNRWTAYAADMNVLISYYNLMDDWEDERKKKSLLSALLIKPFARKVEKNYPRQKEAVEQYLRLLHQAEQDRAQDLDLAAGLTGRLFSVLYAPASDEWEKELGAIGYYIGKFIYLMDAYDDVYEDREKGNYNPFESLSFQEDFEQRAEQILTMMMAEAARAFEKLPILEEVDILRNVLYSGIWSKFDRIKKERIEGKNPQENQKPDRKQCRKGLCKKDERTT